MTLSLAKEYIHICNQMSKIEMKDGNIQSRQVKTPKLQQCAPPPSSALHSQDWSGDGRHSAPEGENKISWEYPRTKDALCGQIFRAVMHGSRTFVYCQCMCTIGSQGVISPVLGWLKAHCCLWLTLTGCWISFTQGIIWYISEEGHLRQNLQRTRQSELQLPETRLFVASSSSAISKQDVFEALILCSALLSCLQSHGMSQNSHSSRRGLRR